MKITDNWQLFCAIKQPHVNKYTNVFSVRKYTETLEYSFSKQSHIINGRWCNGSIWTTEIIFHCCSLFQLVQSFDCIKNSWMEIKHRLWMEESACQKLWSFNWDRFVDKIISSAFTGKKPPRAPKGVCENKLYTNITVCRFQVEFKGPFNPALIRTSVWGSYVGYGSVIKKQMPIIVFFCLPKTKQTKLANEDALK